MRPSAVLRVLIVKDLLRLCLGGSHTAFAGPYDIVVRSMGNCVARDVPDQMSPLDVDMRCITRHNRTTRIPVFDFNLTLANGVFGRGTSKVALDVAKWDTVSGWRNHFLVMGLGEYCFAHEEILGDIMKIVQMPKKCPVPDKTYMGREVSANIGPMRHFPSLPYGRYRVYNIYSFLKRTKGPQVRGCMHVIVDIIPRGN